MGFGGSRDATFKAAFHVIDYRLRDERFARTCSRAKFVLLVHEAEDKNQVTGTSGRCSRRDRRLNREAGQAPSFSCSSSSLSRNLRKASSRRRSNRK